MGGSYAPPSGGNLTMPIPLLHVDGTPTSFNPSAASNKTIASYAGDLSQVVWNSSTDPAATARSLYVSGSDEYGPRLTIGHKPGEGFINTSGIFALRLNSIEYLSADPFSQQINLSVAGQQALRIHPNGGAFFGSTPINPGAGNVQVEAKLIAQNIDLSDPFDAVIQGIEDANLKIRNFGYDAITIAPDGIANVVQALQVQGGTRLVQLISQEFVAEQPIGSGDFSIAAGDSVEFTIFTDGTYTDGAVVATWQASSTSIGQLRLQARVVSTAQIILRITNEAATTTILSGSASFPIVLCILGFDYAAGSGY